LDNMIHSLAVDEREDTILLIPNYEQEGKMSLKAQDAHLVPEETARVARAVYPQGNLYMRWYDAFGTLFRDEEFRSLFSHEGQPAISPARLLLVCILQFVEGLTDRQAADAVRTRIDWKYLLCLELTDAGFDHTVLSEFRTRLIEGSPEQLILDRLLAHFQAEGLLKRKGQQRSDSTHILSAVRAMKRVECVGEAMRHALNTLAVAAPDWVIAHAHPDWIERYGTRIEEQRLPGSKAKRQIYVEQVGTDGLLLLKAIYAPTAPNWLSELLAVETLRCIWVQNYTWREDGQLRWRQERELPPAKLYISSPYDTEARYSRKRSTPRVGYKVHLTETYDDEIPDLITNVETTPATTADGAITTAIHESLQEKGLLPTTHTADTGYVDSGLLLNSREAFGVELVGPTRSGGRKGGFGIDSFLIDWDQQQAVCPAGRTSKNWTPAIDRGKNEVVKIKFSRSDCGNCHLQEACTRSNPPRRTLTIRTKEWFLALQKAREQEQSEAFIQQYAKRAGIEGTISQGIRRCGMRRSRYIGLAKTHLQHLLIAAAINRVRVMQWLLGERPSSTRHSAFVRIYAAAA
jgi:transposase